MAPTYILAAFLYIQLHLQVLSQSQHFSSVKSYTQAVIYSHKANSKHKEKRSKGYKQAMFDIWDSYFSSRVICFEQQEQKCIHVHATFIIMQASVLDCGSSTQQHISLASTLFHFHF